MTEQRTMLLTKASTIKTKRQRWLWDKIIPLGTTTIFGGRGGEGKSTFALYLAAEAAKGNLQGDLKGIETSVLIISHEDDWGTVMNPRLTAAGADLDKVFQVRVAWTDTNEKGDTVTGESGPMFPLDLDVIRAALEETGARIIIVDPITSTMSGDLHKVADVRRALDPLSTLAQELDVTVIGIMHFNKGGGNASDKLSGSHGFRDVGRSVLLFATDEESGQRVITIDKSSYAKSKDRSFAFNLVSTLVQTDDGETADVARVEFLGDSDLSVSDIINREPRGEGESEDRNAAQGFLIDYLKAQDGHEANAGDVIKAGRVAGFSEIEMKNARKRSKNPRIESRKSGFGAGWVWGMTSEGVTEGVQGVTFSNPDTFDTFVTPSTASAEQFTAAVGEVRDRVDESWAPEELGLFT